MTPEQRTAYVMAWIGRMGAHGGIVYDRERSTARWDWGQALCREQYGLDWMEMVKDDPSEDDVRRAKAWEEGDWPAWAWTTGYDNDEGRS